MQAHNKNSSNGFLHNILVSGVKPFRHRGRVNNLLGITTSNDQDDKPVAYARQAGLQSDYQFNTSENIWPENRSGMVYQTPVENLSEVYSTDTSINKKYAEQTESTEKKAKVYSLDQNPTNVLAEKEITAQASIKQAKERPEKYSETALPAESSQVSRRVKNKSGQSLNPGADEIHSNEPTAIETLSSEENENIHKEDIFSAIKPAIKPEIKPVFVNNRKKQRISLYEKNIDESTGINQFVYSIPGTKKNENNRFEFSVDSSTQAKLNKTTNTEEENSVKKIDKLKSKTTRTEIENKRKQAVKIKTKNSVSKNKSSIQPDRQDKKHTGKLMSSTKDEQKLMIKHPALMKQLHAIEQLERAVGRLQNKNTEKKSVTSEEKKSKHKSNNVAPVVKQQVIVRQQHIVLNKSPAAFWERSYLSKIGIRHFK